MCTGTPILDEDGEVILVIINVRDQEVVERYLEALEHERMKAVRYKAATEYLNEKNVEPYLVVMKNHKMREIIEKSAQIAKWDSTVMLFGESGTGKEVVAKYIHWYSPRAKEPFIPVNCAAVPSELMESEFFGYVSGAFTGASTKGKTGLFEIAHKGTLFLDEIGELPLIMQSKLLRVIETGEVQRLGSTSVFKTDVRLIAATNRDLQAMVAQKLFRHDLYYRLNVIPIFMPPLRDRPEDILALAETFLGEFNRKYGLKKELAPRAVQALMNYNWPGNVRELRNVIERLVVTTVSNYLDFEDDILISKKVPVAPSDDASSKAATPTYRGALKNVLKAYEEEYINRVLAECNGRMGEAAQKLGIHRTVLYRKKKAAL
jgi:transcriptional regulator with PAS, ATPase and Fis domain